MKTFLPAVMILCVLSAALNPAFAQTWTQQTNAPGGIQVIALSADGSKLVAGAYGGIYSSTNTFTTWITNNLPFKQGGLPLKIASSADGNKLVLACFGTSIFTSMDSGATWVTNYVTVENWAWTSVASSGDGGILVAANSHQVAPGVSIFESTNSGATWFSISLPPRVSAPGFTAIVLSAEGSKLAAASGAGVYISTNSGTTWISNNVPSAESYSVAMSADGSKLLAAAYNGGIYTSTDSGTTWISNNVPSANWSSVAMSADGSKLVAAAYNGEIYASTDSGTTWISNNVPSTSWYSVASSADGCKMIAAGNSGIWATQMTPTPQLNFTLSNANLAFSWLVPSTNFVLEQNLDLTTTNWMTLTNAPMLNLTNLQDEVIISPSNSSGFFRLMAQ
jgi:photosystem II stability/assembly factor-like uncharacterized protein